MKRKMQFYAQFIFVLICADDFFQKQRGRRVNEFNIENVNSLQTDGRRTKR